MTWRIIKHLHKHLRLSYFSLILPFRQRLVVGGCSYCDNPRDKSDRRKVFTVALQHRFLKSQFGASCPTQSHCPAPGHHPLLSATGDPTPWTLDTFTATTHRHSAVLSE